MPRIRSIKPSFFVNDELGELLPVHRLFYIGLWTQADREGRLEYRPKKLKATILPYDDIAIEQLVDELVAKNFLLAYQVTGSSYLAIPVEKWAKHQRIRDDEAVSILPAPCSSAVTAQSLNGIGLESEPSYEHHSVDTLTEYSLSLSRSRSSKKGAEEEPKKDRTCTPLRTRFERFWGAYPRKVGKAAAWSLWQRLKPHASMTDAIVSAIDKQRTSTQWQTEHGRYIPHPRTWLSQGRWEDEVAPTGDVGYEASDSVPNVQQTRQYIAELDAIGKERQR